MTTSQPPLFQTQDLCISQQNKTLCQQLNLTVYPGQSIAILGQNGSGKSTLLHTLQGLHQADHGEIHLSGQALSKWTGRGVAQRVGLLLQQVKDEMPSRVDDFAMLGRLPHSRFWKSDSEQDRNIVAKALSVTDLSGMSARDVESLSGGERQRLAIAMLLAQDPDLYLLDEPGNHLDIAHQISLMTLLHQHIKSMAKAMVFATHDMNLAARFADKVLLLNTDGSYLFGLRDDILSESSLSDVYGHPVRQAQTDTDYPVFFPG
ncbi:ABC transporter ATP-binding protein [Pseudohongiella nitratireducens]|uniref:ABC transporter ATP-binding protein n=1 Tax=Pseudohongiella nitratireducens TaxID=1768907 RepID=UPI0030EC815E|tara:strand:- start:1318 stop:2103 length:786 start_codon:yes stop_codon:yes gene_type:complete